MQNHFADFYNRLIRTASTSFRPTSASPGKLTPKYAHSQYTSMRTTKKSVNQSMDESHNKLKLSHRLYSKSQNKNKAKSVSALSRGSNKTQYRFQVINHHCIKKVAIEPEPLTLSMFSNKKDNFGEGLRGYVQKRRHEFIGRKLKCLRNKNHERLKTQPGEVEHAYVSVTGTKIF